MANRSCKLLLALIVLDASAVESELQTFAQALSVFSHNIVERVAPAGLSLRSAVTLTLTGVSAQELDIWSGQGVGSEPEKMRSLFERSVLPSGKSVYFVRSVDGKRKYLAGFFEELSITELREKTKNITSNKPTTLTILYGKLDIGMLQALPENNGALFQVASNFSALEPISASSTPENWNIDKYCLDNTQGPKASLSAAPGLLYRMYGVFQQEGPKYTRMGVQYYGAKDPAHWRQITNRQIDLLSETDIPTKNGYITLTPEFVASLEMRNLAQEMLPLIKVGLHRDIQVTFGDQSLADDKHASLMNSDQIIHQVFTAALDFGSNAAYKNNPVVQELARIILRAAYEGTLRAAILNGTKRVVLTLIGGGVFANAFDMIYNELLSAIDAVKQAGLDVQLNVFGATKSKAESLAQMAMKRGIEAKVATV